MDWLINTRILSNPWNWLSISAMLLLVFVAAMAIRSRLANTSTVADLPDNPAAAMQKET